MMEESRKRMMEDVPEADVVITNPIHIAVAIKYDANISDAPRVLAKGKRLIAEQIKGIARENNIPIVEDKPLARMLYKTTEVGEEINLELYEAVAEILAIVYKQKNKKVGS
jgi:flagellar biosynthetic protein FlhB